MISHNVCVYMTDSLPPRWIQSGQTLPYVHVLLIYHMDFTAVWLIQIRPADVPRSLCNFLVSRSERENVDPHISPMSLKSVPEALFRVLSIGWREITPTQRTISELVLADEMADKVNLKMQNAARQETWCKCLSWTAANANLNINHMQTNFLLFSALFSKPFHWLSSDNKGSKGKEFRYFCVDSQLQLCDVPSKWLVTSVLAGWKGGNSSAALGCLPFKTMGLLRDGASLNCAVFPHTEWKQESIRGGFSIMAMPEFPKVKHLLTSLLCFVHKRRSGSHSQD